MDVARKLKTSEPTVCKWRKRFLEQRVPGLLEAPRPNVHRKLGDERVEKVIQATLATIPRGATHWSTRKMARVAGVSQSSVSRIWRAFGLKPHRTRTFTLSTDDFFIEKVRDIAGLYMNPPDNVVVLCLDEKTQIQALERRQPLLPLDFGQPQRRTHTYHRHGTTNLFAAFDTSTGEVIGECFPRKRPEEFRRFLRRSSHRSTAELEDAIFAHIEATNEDPKPFVWTKTADQIIASVSRFCARTLAQADS